MSESIEQPMQPLPSFDHEVLPGRDGFFFIASPDEESLTGYMLTSWILIGCVSVFVNSLLIYIYVKNKSFRKHFTNHLIALLACCDLVMGIGVIIRTVDTILYIPDPVLGYTTRHCAWTGLTTLIGIVCSQCTILWIAVDRVLAVKLMHRYNGLDCKKRISVVVTSWVIFTALFVGLLFASLGDGYCKECSIGEAISPFYKIFFLNFGFGLGCVIAGSYVYIAVTVKHKLITDQFTSAMIQKKVFKSITLILTAYFIFCSIPYIIISIDLHFNILTPFWRGHSTQVLAVCQDINSCVNFFIYLVIHDDINKHVMSMLGRREEAKHVRMAATQQQRKRLFGKHESLSV